MLLQCAPFQKTHQSLALSKHAQMHQEKGDETTVVASHVLSNLIEYHPHPAVYSSCTFSREGIYYHTLNVQRVTFC